MNELADKMAKIVVNVLVSITGAIVFILFLWALWGLWSMAAPLMFADWPASITSPGLLPFAAAFVVLSLSGYGWRR